MTTKVAVRKRDAEKVLAAVTHQRWLGGTPPVLVKDYETWGGDVAPWAILWEEGPYEWPYLFPFGGIEEEFGFTVRDVSAMIPSRVFAEPLNGWSIAIYPA